MRVDLDGEKTFARALLVVLLGGLALVGFLVDGVRGGVLAAALGTGVAFVVETLVRRRGARRRALLALPFSDAGRNFLLETYDHYDRLPPDWRRRFEDDVRVFVAEKRITGVEVDVTEELRLLVAASAVTVSLGWPHYEWDQLTEVLLYPQDFDRDYRFGGDDDELSGQAHPWGTVILSVPSLRESFEDPDDGFHVGIHEFAHLLNASRGDFGEIPAGLGGGREWVELAEREMERLRRGKSVLDDYGAHDPVEFLAVAVEGFFEMPLLLRQRHRELYDILARYFGQDPAAWDDERGLVL